MSNKQKAISRLTDELAQVPSGNRYVNVVKNAVAEALMDCCNKSETFAAAIADSDNSLSDCLTSICKNIGSSISDAEIFRRAVQFYFPEADVHWNIEIVCGDKQIPAKSAPRTGKIISIFDLDI